MSTVCSVWLHTCADYGIIVELCAKEAAVCGSFERKKTSSGELVQKGHHERDEVDLFLILCAGGVSGLVFVHALLLRTKPIFMFVPFCAMHIL